MKRALVRVLLCYGALEIVSFNINNNKLGCCDWNCCTVHIVGLFARAFYEVLLDSVLNYFAASPGACPARVVRWLDHLDAMCSRA